MAKTPYGWLNQNSHLLVFAKTMFKEIFGIGAVNEVKRPTIKSSKKPVQAVNEKSLQPQFTVSFDQFNYLTANQSKIIAVTIAHLKRIVKLSKKVNLPLIVAWIPSPEEMLPTNKNVEINLFFRSARQRFKALEKQYERYRFIDTVWPIEMNENWKQRAITLRLSDGHFNINGNEWYATHIRPQIIKFLQDQLAIPIIRDN
ncbi:MAG: hypothetical protein QF493_09530 [Rhodospirillales bacterium]|nr:hypothetical protein [Rhodospirillales bacterium]